MRSLPPTLSRAISALRLGNKRNVTAVLHVALTLIGIGVLAMFVDGLVRRNTIFQGDFKTYMWAAQAARSGLDPYQPEVLAQLAGRRLMPFVYPPIALTPFIGLSWFPPKLAAMMWIWCKCGLLIGLVVLWKRVFLRRDHVFMLAVLAVFGWNSAAQWDLATGNVALIEAALLWLAFALYVKGHHAWFAGLVVTAACFKIAPAAFLLLLVVPTSVANASPKLLFGSVLALAVLTFGPVFVGPVAHWQEFSVHVPDATHYGDSNPSGLGLVVASLASLGLRGTNAAAVATLTWAIGTMLLLGVSVPFLRSLWSSRDANRWVMSAVCTYTLVLPRPMAYGFALLTPALLFLAPRPFDQGSWRSVLVVVLCAGYVQSNSVFYVYAPRSERGAGAILQAGTA